MADVRIRRMESLLREEISQLILRNEIKDPRVDSLLSVSGVTASKDLVYAKVRISGFHEPSQLESAVAGLNSAAGFIQRRLGRVLNARHTPKLTFVADHSIQEGFEVNKSLDDLKPESG